MDLEAVEDDRILEVVAGGDGEFVIRVRVGGDRTGRQAQRRVSDDVPPVVPIVNIQLGARFQLAPQLSINLETGFRDVFFVGLGTDYFF